MRHRVPSLERFVLAVFVPLWVVGFGLSVRTMVSGVQISHVTTLPPPAPDAYPAVAGVRPYATVETGLAPGDRLLRLDDFDLRGIGPLAFQTEVQMRVPPDASPRVVVERGGEVRTEALPTGPYAFVIWPFLPLSLSCAIVCVVLALRGRHDATTRWGTTGLALVALQGAFHFGGSPRLAAASYALSAVLWGLTPVVLLHALMRFPSGDGPRSARARAAPLLYAPITLIMPSTLYGFPFAISPHIGYRVLLGALVAFVASCLVVVVPRYRDADPVGRRQSRWFVLGLYAAGLIVAAGVSLAMIDDRFFPVAIASIASSAIVPVALLVSMTRYNLFDVDRLLSATAAYNVVIGLLAGLGIALVPRIADASSATLGVDPSTTQVALSLALAAVVVPCERRLRPQIERIFFRDRHSIDEGISRLVEEIPESSDPTALTRLLAERLHAIFRPEVCAVYAIDEDEARYAPIFAAGAGVPTAFEAEGTLATALRGQSRATRLLAAGEDLGPFDRAALETLGASVVIPVHRRDLLFAFVCLGPRRSGDVYTPTDLRLLGQVAEKASGELRRFEQEALLRESQAMQAALRRYVPGAVADELDAGGDLQSGEQEVTVLFVDIRGYTSFAESRGPAEIFSTVNRYTETVSEIVRKNGGSVVEFNGDGMMTVFGAPRPLPDKERAALAAAEEIVRAVPAITPDGAAPLGVGVGIATGEAFVGSIRSADRLIWTAIGNTTNLAARLQSLTRDLDVAIVVDDATRRSLGARGSEFVAHPQVRVRGRSEPIAIHALAIAADA